MNESLGHSVVVRGDASKVVAIIRRASEAKTPVSTLGRELTRTNQNEIGPTIELTSKTDFAVRVNHPAESSSTLIHHKSLN
jgi:hypothetical protein